MSRIALYAFSLSLFFVGSKAYAQGALTELYGEGVHRYFACDFLGAEQLFSQVINSGSEDPRAYYFRGLVQENMGGSGELDFEMGARLEAEGKTAINVGFALSRIQGCTRAKIEEARRAARATARQTALATERARIESAATQPPETTAPADATPGADTAPVPADPFSDDGGMRSGETTVDPVQPSPPEVDSVNNPFGDDTTPPPATNTPAADAPAGGNPFGTPAPADSGNPFGTPAPAETGNPFGADPAGAGNPFGN